MGVEAPCRFAESNMDTLAPHRAKPWRGVIRQGGAYTAYGVISGVVSILPHAEYVEVSPLFCRQSEGPITCCLLRKRMVLKAE